MTDDEICVNYFLEKGTIVSIVLKNDEKIHGVIEKVIQNSNGQPLWVCLQPMTQAYFVELFGEEIAETELEDYSALEDCEYAAEIIFVENIKRITLPNV